MVRVQEQQQKSKDRETRSRDREKYRGKTKASEIKASQADSYLLQLMQFEEEMRDEDRRGRDLVKIFTEAVRNSASGTILSNIKASAVGQEFTQRAAAASDPDREDAIWDEYYKYIRGRIYLEL